MIKNRSLSISAVKERAKAIEIPPLNPPQVIIMAVLGTKSRYLPKKVTGGYKERYLDSNTIGIAANPSNMYV